MWCGAPFKLGVPRCTLGACIPRRDMSACSIFAIESPSPRHSQFGRRAYVVPSGRSQHYKEYQHISHHILQGLCHLETYFRQMPCQLMQKSSRRDAVPDTWKAPGKWVSTDTGRMWSTSKQPRPVQEASSQSRRLDWGTAVAVLLHNFDCAFGLSGIFLAFPLNIAMSKMTDKSGTSHLDTMKVRQLER